MVNSLSRAMMHSSVLISLFFFPLNNDKRLEPKENFSKPTTIHLHFHGTFLYWQQEVVNVKSNISLPPSLR